MSTSQELIKEVFIIDNASQDNTPDVVRSLRAKYPEIEYTRFRKRVNCSYYNQWNEGVERATGDVIRIYSDDVWSHPSSTVLGAYLMNKLMSIRTDIRILCGPYYTRSTLPSGVLPTTKISSISPFDIYFNYEFFPDEFLRRPTFLDEKRAILSPITNITNIGGNRFYEAKSIKEIGLHKDGLIEGGYTNETLQFLKFAEMGYSAVFCPDPRLSWIHFLFGNSAEIKGDLRYSHYFGSKEDELAAMIQLSKNYNEPTGTRVESGNMADRWLYATLRNHLILKFRRMKGSPLPFFPDAFKRIFDVIGGGNVEQFYPDQLSLQEKLRIYVEAIVNAVCRRERDTI